TGASCCCDQRLPTVCWLEFLSEARTEDAIQRSRRFWPQSRASYAPSQSSVPSAASGPILAMVGFFWPTPAQSKYVSGAIGTVSPLGTPRAGRCQGVSFATWTDFQSRFRRRRGGGGRRQESNQNAESGQHGMGMPTAKSRGRCPSSF